MEELFADLCHVPRLVGQRRGFRPRLDVYRTEDPPTITVIAELAGVDPATLELALVDGALLVAGERKRDAGGAKRVYQQMEIDYGPFQRRVPLSVGVDAERVEAKYERGFLTIVLPIAARPARRVRVEIGARGSA